MINIGEVQLKQKAYFEKLHSSHRIITGAMRNCQGHWIEPFLFTKFIDDPQRLTDLSKAVALQRQM